MKTKMPAVVFSLVTVFIIGLTFYFLIQKENFVQTNVSVSDVGVVANRIALADGVTQEVRNEVPVKEWKYSTGTVVTLYEKDYFYSDFSTEPAKQISLRVVRNGNEQQELYANIPTAGVIAGGTIGKVEFSPLGTYMAVSVGGYESWRSYIFDLRTGELLNNNEPNHYDWNDWPHWNENEQRVLILRSGSAMSGTPARIAYSQTGKMKDLVDIVDIGELINRDNKDQKKETFDAGIEHTVSSGAKVSFEVISYGFDGEEVIPMTFDFETGLVTRDK